MRKKSKKKIQKTTGLGIANAFFAKKIFKIEFQPESRRGEEKQNVKRQDKDGQTILGILCRLGGEEVPATYQM